MSHTPGPWNLRADPDDREAWIIVDASHSSFRVCDVSPRFGAKEELRNARLIAAAPEMLAALSDVMPLLAECDCIHSDRDAPLCPCRSARALLARVTAIDGEADAS